MAFENTTQYQRVTHWLVHNRNAHVMMYVLAVPHGFAYGACSSNVYNNLRQRIANEQLREFALGNVRQAVAYGQIIGTLLAIPIGLNR